MPLYFSSEVKKSCEESLRELTKKTLVAHILETETRHDKYGNPTKRVRLFYSVADLTFDFTLKFAAACELPYYDDKTLGIYGYPDVEDVVKSYLEKFASSDVRVYKIFP